MGRLGNEYYFLVTDWISYSTEIGTARKDELWFILSQFNV